MTTQPPDTLHAALAWSVAGCSVIPVALDGTKAPLVNWKPYQTNAPTPDQIRTWFVDGHPGLGIITGTVSDHLEMLEFEGRAVDEGLIPLFAQACAATGHNTTWATVSTGCAVMSPSHGLHLYYRVEGGVDGNTKLASRHAHDDELTPDEQTRLTAGGKRPVRVLIETRGEGGFVVAPPSYGSTHPSGKPWRYITGSPDTIPTITADQRDALHIIARDLDQLPPPQPIPEPTVLHTDRHNDTNNVAPGTDYNQRGSWRELLEPHGWRLVSSMSTPARQYWTRPGKAHGVSAVTGGDNDYFWSWSTSTELPTEAAMSKWRVYAHLEHGGDFHAAAVALKKQGYGQSPPPPTRPVLTILTRPTAPVDGNNARQPDPQTSPVTLAHSDDANALTLVDAYGDRIRYCPERGRWLHWTGHKWEWCPSTGGAIREYAKHIARSLSDTDPTAIRHKQRALSAIGTTAMLTQAATDERVVVGLHKLDARLYELNTPNGIIDLRDATLHPADPTHLHTRSTTVAPDFTADHTRWQQFLADTFTGHDELPDYLQRLIGYAATGVVRDHVLPFCFGPGANGKGVFLETLRAVLGDYATTAPSGFLMAKNYAGHETEIARLAGARMVVCSEINEGDRFDEAKVKQLTGGDALTARFMRQDHFTFQPTHKLWLMGNHQPSVTGGGHSFWRRLRIVPFLNTVPEEKRVDDLQGILAEQNGGAILAWIIAGAAAYFDTGLQEPESIRAATEEYAIDQDTVSRFVNECCHVAPGNHHAVRTVTSKLRAAYESWATAEGETPVTPKRLGMELRSRFGVEIGRSSGLKLYTGIALLATEPDPRTGSDR